MALSIIIFGAIIAAFIWVFQRKQLKKGQRVVIISGIALILIAAFVVMTSFCDTQYLGEGEKWYNLSPFYQIIFFLIMTTGMAVRYVAKAIEDRRDKIRKLKIEADKDGMVKLVKPGLEFDMWEFSYPFLFSVVTFGALLSQVDSKAVTIANIILSFQTGFFWQTLLKKEL
jgi:hypothetical protein